LAGKNHSLPAHKLKTPPELFAIREAILKGKPLPEGVVADNGVYQPRVGYFTRFVEWIRPRKGCGCKRREALWNSYIPWSGTAFRWLTTLTGIKWLVDKWYQELAKQSPTGFRTARSATPSTKSDTSHYPDNQP
jgi:hypothetical protein